MSKNINLLNHILPTPIADQHHLVQRVSSALYDAVLMRHKTRHVQIKPKLTCSTAGVIQVH